MASLTSTSSTSKETSSREYVAGLVLVEPFFGVVFGLVSILSQTGDKLGNIYDGFNGAAIGTVVALATSELLVSFVSKYLDNFAKCVIALSMIVVGVAHASASGDGLQLPLVIGIVLTSIALEQYSLS